VFISIYKKLCEAFGSTFPKGWKYLAQPFPKVGNIWLNLSQRLEIFGSTFPKGWKYLAQPFPKVE
jgi:hypothetical protein